MIVFALGALVACGDDEPTPTEAACEDWNAMVLQDPPPSDREVADRLRSMDLDAVDNDVAGAIVAVASRLEDGSDISGAYRQLSDLCT